MGQRLFIRPGKKKTRSMSAIFFFLCFTSSGECLHWYVRDEWNVRRDERKGVEQWSPGEGCWKTRGEKAGLENKEADHDDDVLVGINSHKRIHERKVNNNASIWRRIEKHRRLQTRISTCNYNNIYFVYFIYYLILFKYLSFVK